MRTSSETLVAMVVALVLMVAAPAVPAEDRAHAAPAPNPFAGLSVSARGAPIKIKSDSLELDYRGGTVTYRGAVHVTQGDLTLTSDRLIIAFNQGALEGATTGGGTAPDDAVAQRIREIVAEGHVRIEQKARVASGRRAVFDQARQTIVLTDDAVLQEGPNQVSGERIVVYLDEQRSVVEGGSRSRVQAVLYPDSVDDDALDVPPVEAKAAPAAPEEQP
jgi:lipopolysaccharide export system protein LptA